MSIEIRVKLEPPKHGIHRPWLPKAARALAMLEKTDQEIFDALRKATAGARRNVSDSEIKDVLALIRETNALAINANGKPAHKATYEPEYLKTIADQISESVDEIYLEARSQFSCWNRTPVGFLHKLYRPGEHVWITTNPHRRTGEIWTHAGLAQRFDELNHLVDGHDGVWFLTNPIDAQLHSVQRRKNRQNPQGLSFSTLECITAWRFLMFETDEAPRELWRKAIVQMRLPIVAIYDSGKNGDHVLVRLEADSKAQWEKLSQQYDNRLVRLGACPGSLTARRLSRLPNCIRGQTGKLQKLLYLCPDADGTPICERATRESPGVVEQRIQQTSAWEDDN